MNTSNNDFKVISENKIHENSGCTTGIMGIVFKRQEELFDFKKQI